MVEDGGLYDVLWTPDFTVNLFEAVAYITNEVGSPMAARALSECVCRRLDSQRVITRRGPAAAWRWSAGPLGEYNNPYLIEAILERPLPPFREQVEEEHALIMPRNILDPSKDVESVRFDVTTVPTTVYVFDK